MLTFELYPDVGDILNEDEIDSDVGTSQILAHLELPQGKYNGKIKMEHLKIPFEVVYNDSGIQVTIDPEYEEICSEPIINSLKEALKEVMFE